ncbi:MULTISPECIES: diaminopimelate decarboxylase [Fervidicoccus]|uniref:Diaminopimelate decarboxylase n=1 Tax=Fervidicoccus fontis TaxID=683846 RepID=A0A2J6N3I1_9CREN|nr:diaminopimelate decarboxylase [Fervidicoccus fontis]PMB75907.1 MAG: diaminopimelate decarboxylase [Fervidicoccus fontis]PMB77396.1 MAG: diaminopimelate decarboxylase [Fervidicoccus fontis]HEW63503.1 diaminopimelate decarboxylase [Fervidicoccus fontis]
MDRREAIGTIKVEGTYLYIGKITAKQLADQYGTPIYVYDKEVLLNNYERLKKSIKYRDLEVLYSCKANNNIDILKVLKEEGSGLDVVSPFEALLGVKLGFQKDKILFTGNNVSNEEMKFLKELGILINIDSISQLKRYGIMFPGTDISIRINPGIGYGHHEYAKTGGLTKFGIYLNEIEAAKEYVMKYNLRIRGIHIHIGSGILQTDPYISALNILLKIANEFKDLEFIDLGGGLGIPYRPGEEKFDLGDFGEKVSSILEDFSRKHGHVKLRIEPGRYIVGSCGVLLVRVVSIKDVSLNGKRKIFIGVDSGMNHLIRPSLYGSYHEIIDVTKASDEKEIVADIVGNICETGDFLALDRPMPKVEEGDVLAVMDAGAYGYSMSSNYNLRPRPAEIFVDGSTAKVSRRRETFEDLLSTFAV